MTVVRRRLRRLGADLALLADLFVHGDGTRNDFDDQPALDVFSARASWPSARAATWALWLEWEATRDPCRPPGGAIAYDGLTASFARMHWPSHQHGLTAAGQRRANRAAAQAARMDLKALRAWVKAHPAEAAGIANGLDQLERALLTVIEIGRSCSTTVEVDQALATVWWRAG